MRITRRQLAFGLAVGGFFALTALPGRAWALPPGFTETQIVPGGGADGVLVPTAIAYEPGAGHLWICEKSLGSGSGPARIRRRHAVTFAVTTALTLTVDSRGERGINGIAFDPDFLDPSGLSRFVYLYYTSPTPAPHDRVVRYSEAGGVLTGEQVVLEGPDLLAATMHVGGCLRFRSDKTLFVSMGDNDTDTDGNPLSRDLSDLRGKILRVNRDGSVPADNPFVGDAGVREEIYAWGLRNPRRFHFDADDDALYIGDVGENCFESIYVGIPGADHGYPCWEGIRPFQACGSPPPGGSVTFPIAWYGHDATGACSTAPVRGNSVIGGPVYRGTAFPQEYRGNYFFGDSASGWIRRARIASDGSLRDIETFANPAAGVIDMAVSPAGCLTYASLSGGGIREICHVDGANAPPEAIASAIPVAGPAPLDVAFTGSASQDPDLDPLAFSWSFGDSGTDTNDDPGHRYAAPGVYQATLTVDDGRGAPNSLDSAPPLRIVVGNSPPTATILSPARGSFYDAGSVIDFWGAGADAQDITIPASRLEWRIALHHATHQHAFRGPLRETRSGQFVVPDTGEDSTSVFYRIHLAVTDSGNPIGPGAALTSRTFVDVFPNVTTTTLAVSPQVPGLRLGWEGVEAAPPFSRDSVVGFRRQVAARTPQMLGSDRWGLVSWSDGGAADHEIVASPFAETITATFRCLSGPGCSEVGRCTDGRDNDYDELVDCADPDCVVAVPCQEQRNCADGRDNDVDTLIDCLDPDCSTFPACMEAGNCGDGADNDLDGTIDCLDPDCVADPVCLEAGNCSDGVDNDLDGPVDCVDSDCATDAICIEAGNCDDAVDNDLDGPVDCVDPECLTDAVCIEAGNCSDGRDNDLDGPIDCADDECFTDAACIEAGNCDDGTDNDLDGLFDCADDECVTDAACIEAGNCNDGTDNDLDGLFDCADDECVTDATCIEAGNCDDARDNDLDGLADCADPECTADPICVEAGNCADGIDNDLDGLPDCADPECTADAACIEAGNCADAVDNDLDGLPDCADPECAADPICIEAGNCGDGTDNDLDGLPDCADDECAADPICIEAGNCNDAADNDLDGLIDCADPECVAESACLEAGNCADGIDNDLDGATDCMDSECFGPPDCIETGLCTDSVDNDFDGLIDCADSDCIGDAGCCACPNGAPPIPGPTATCQQVTDGVDTACRSRFYSVALAAGECYWFSTCTCGNASFDSILTLRDASCAVVAASDDEPGCGTLSHVEYTATVSGTYFVEATGFASGAGSFTLGYGNCSIEGASLGNCDDGIDDDADGLVDCEDPGCVTDAACSAEDLDGDGEPNATDCAPLDPGAFGVVAEIARLDVARLPALGRLGLRLSWTDESPATGSATVYDVAAARISTLARATAANAPCVATARAAPTLDEAVAVTNDGRYYLVRARNACGEGTWGSDSLGSPRPTCP